MIQQTVILLKPEAVKRGITGKIIERFEQMGFKIVACKMVWVDAELVGKHYKNDPKYLTKVGENSLKYYTGNNLDPIPIYGSAEPLAVGKKVRQWLMRAITSGPVIAMVLEAPHAVELARKLAGATNPLVSLPGTIRGDFAPDSYIWANRQNRAIQTIIHASGSVEEAEFEKNLWFKKEEIFSNYKRADQDLTWGE